MPHAIRRSLTAAAVLFAAAAALRAGDDLWTSNGPEGGRIYSLAVDATNPALVYVVNPGGLYRSTDGALTWSPVGGSLPQPVTAVCTDPSSPSVVYASAVATRIFRSSDGGATWAERAPVPVPGADVVRKLISDPSYPGALFASTGGAIYRSTAGVTGWTNSSAGLPPSDWISDFTVVPGAPSTLFAALPSGVYRSANGGVSWFSVSSGPIIGAAARSVGTLSGSAGTVFTGLGDGRMFRSMDGGGTWTFSVICTLPTMFAASASSPSTIYAACGNFILRSTDSGDSWTPTQLPSGSLVILGLGAAASSSTTVYAADLRGAYRTSNGGANWYAANSGLRNTTISAVAIDPVTPNVVLAGENDSGSIFRSPDGGQSWSAAWTVGGLGQAVAIDPSTHLRAYGGGELGLRKTVDGGLTWMPTPLSGLVNDIRIDPSSPTTVYAATGAGVYKSTDAGGTWNPPSSGLTTYVTRVAIDGANTQTLYAGTFGQGLFKSVDGGAVWSPVPSPGIIISDVIVTPGPPSSVLVSVNGGGLFRSGDGGSTWDPAGSGLGSLFVSALAMDPSTPSTIYAGSEDAGLWRSTDGAAHFVPFSAGYPSANAVRRLAVSPSGRFLVAGSTGAGVFTHAITSSNFYSVIPCRVLDTRDPNGPYGGPALVSGFSRGFSIYGRCGIPAGARAVVANVVVTRPSAAGFVAAWPGGTALPNTSTLNFVAGQTRAANATLKLGAAGDLLLVVNMSSAGAVADVILDVTGYYGP